MNFFNVVGSLLETYGMVLAGFSLLGVNIRKSIISLSFIGIAGGTFIFLMKENFQPLVVLPFSILFLVLLSIPLLRISFTKTVVSMLTGLALVFISELITIYPLYYFMDPGYLSMKTHPQMLFLIALPHILILFALALICYLKKITIFPQKWTRYNTVDAYLNKFQNKHHSFIFVILGILTIGLFFITSKTMLIYQIENSKFLIITALILSSFLIYIVRQMLDTGMERIEYHLEKEYRQDLESYVQIIKSQRHDLNHHLNAMFGMLENEEYEECKSYIKEINADVGAVNAVMPLHQSAISAMLLTLQKKADKQNLNLNYYIHTRLDYIPCPVYEMNKVLGNLIQNALDHVEETEEKWVDVSIEETQSHYKISVINPGHITEDVIEKMFQDSYTTKDSASHDGTGLPTIQRILKDYNGIVTPQLVDDKVHMIAILPIQKG